MLLEDLQSNNGTFINRQKLTSHTELNNADQVRIGHFLFSIDIFAAIAAASRAGEHALNSWILEEKSPRGRAATPYCPTENDIDLDSLTFPAAL